MKRTRTSASVADEDFGIGGGRELRRRRRMRTSASVAEWWRTTGTGGRGNSGGEREK